MRSGDCSKAEGYEPPSDSPTCLFCASSIREHTLYIPGEHDLEGPALLLGLLVELRKQGRELATTRRQ